MTDGLLAVEGITKTFGAVLANDDIDFDLSAGEVHSILGENGAGKSTFMKILYGVYQQDSGRMRVRGHPHEPDSPADALANGIGLVYQEFKLIESFSVLDNVVLGLPTGSLVSDDVETHRDDIADLSETLGLGLADRLDLPVEELSEGEKQRAEILKVLYRDVDILLLDEPTSILTPQEVDEIFEVLQTLVDEEGLGVVLITHKLEEALEISDRITVFRDGQVVGETEPAAVDRHRLAELMVGREDVTALEAERVEHGGREPLLEVDGLTVRDVRGQEGVRDVSITVERGEVLGVVGVEGNGQQELVRALTGLQQPDDGRIAFDGTDVTGHGRQQLHDQGMLYVPDSHGVIEEFTIPDNCILDYHEEFYDGFVINEDRISKAAESIVEEYDVRIPSMSATAGQLSGGNKQKIVVGRKLSYDDRDLVIAVNPTKGLDVDTKTFIHDKLVEERNAGRSVVLVTTDLEEAMTVADRLAVLQDGRVVRTIADPAATTKQAVGLAMTGGEQE